MVKNGWFCVTDFCHVIPKVAGFYAIYLLNLQTHNKELVYLGTASNLETRLKSHEVIRILRCLYEYPIHVDIKCKIFISKLPHRRTIGWFDKYDQTNNERKIIEAKLINRLQPKLNKQGR